MSLTDAHYDELEIRSAEDREKAHFTALSNLIADAQTNSPYFRNILAGVTAKDINSREALASLPVTRKSDLMAIQKEKFPLKN